MRVERAGGVKREGRLGGVGRAVREEWREQEELDD